jgi:hypothetical protein
MAEDKMTRVWRRFQEVMEYSDEDLARFKATPRFVQMMNTPAFRTHKIVAEVVYSHGCVCQHEMWQRLVMSGNGALLREECPPLMCVSLVSQFTPVTAALFERITAGLDPNGLLFDTVGCTDVGIKCGGWGRVLVKIHVEGPEGK